jgi:HK97 family phage prohead protease
MFDTKVSRAEAADARQQAIRIKDGDVTPHGVRLTRYTNPMDVGPSRRLSTPMAFRATLHKRATCDCDDCDAEGNCTDCTGEGIGETESFWAKFSGIASVTERDYEMWDMFGPYTERVARTAFDQSLSSNPDVAFLVNHTGMTMARTTNGTLQLRSTAEGLAVSAMCNYDRADVKDFTIAVRDGHIDQMSFAAYLEQGEWNDDCTQFTMTQLDLNCGDVSGVNFGANPHTSIAARAQRVLEEIDRLPAGVARVATRQLESRLGAVPASLGGANRSMNGSGMGAGRSLALIRSSLMADDD